MTTAITTQTASTPSVFLTAQDIDLMRRTIAREANDAEFEMFVKIATLRQLNPLLNQISLQIRNAGDSKKRAAVIITTIHGLRLVAARTGCYMPGRDTTYQSDQDGQLFSATAFVKKYHPASATWHEVSETAYWDEFVQTYWNDRNNAREMSGLWGSKPRLMLAKCAEALALRRAFPEDLSGLYTDDEMGAQDPAPAPTASVSAYTVSHPTTGDVIDQRPAPSAPALPQPQAQRAPQPQPPAKNGGSANPVTKVQRANLLLQYGELHGVDEAGALTGVDEMFTAKFGHGIDEATYNEGAVIMAQILQAKQAAAAA